MTATSCPLLVEAASYNLYSPLARGSFPSVAAQPLTRTNPHRAIRSRRMLFTSPSIHRPARRGSQLTERGCDLYGPGFGEVAFDAHDRASIVEDQRVAGQAHGLVPEVPVRVQEDEHVR